MSRAPRLVFVTYAATIAVALPLTAAIAREIVPTVTVTALAEPDARLIPSDAWAEMGSHASGLASTFTPAILGLAAPLDNMSRVLDGGLPPPAVLGAVATYGAVWLLLWGGVIDAFARGWQGWTRFALASGRLVVPLFVIAVVGLAAYAVVLLVISPRLIVPLANALASKMAPVAGAIVRMGAYVVVAVLLLATSTWIDYGRVQLVAGGARRPLAAGLRFVRNHPAQVFIVCALNAALLAAVLGGYGAFELSSRGVPRAWTAIAAGQLFVLARLAARLVATAAQVRLFQRLESAWE